MRNAAIGACLALALSAPLQAFGRIPKREYQAKVDELQRVQKELEAKTAAADAASAEARAKIESLESQNEQLLNDLQSNKNELQNRVASLMKEKQDVEKEKQSEVDRLKSTYDNLVSDMKKEIDQGTIQITQLQNKLSVNLVDKILFTSGEAEVSEQGRQVLKRVADILKKVQNKQIRIEGHTDNVPIGGSLKEKFPSNWELSTARATNVSRYLQESGVKPGVLSAAGFAEFRPIADNATAEGRSKNRRIEIALVPLETSGATPARAPAPPAPAKSPK